MMVGTMVSPDPAQSALSECTSTVAGTQREALTISSDSGLWCKAFKLLGERDQNQLKTLPKGQKSNDSIIKDLLDATQRRKEECFKRKWKVKIAGREIVIHDILDKISSWISKVQAVGDILIQIDPVHAAAPWAAYLQPENKLLTTYAELSQSVITQYKNILEFLSEAVRFYESSTLDRVIQSVTTSKSDIEAKYQPILTGNDVIDAWTRVADAEKSNLIIKKTNEIFKLETDSNEESSKLCKVLQELQGPITRTASHLENITDNLERDTRRKILNTISVLEPGRHHKRVTEDRLEGTGQWLLQKPDFCNWRRDSVSSVLWLHGIPGSGKTKLASLVVDELRAYEKVAYFYCIRSEAEQSRGRADKILASLVRQLACLRPQAPILEPVMTQYTKGVTEYDLPEYGDHAWPITDSEKVLMRLLEEYPAVTLVIDALDEVQQQDRGDLLATLTRLARNAPNLLKIFISSRYNYDIVLELKGFPNIYIDAEDSQADIKRFIDRKLETFKLPEGNGQNELRAEIATVLGDKGGGMFRWVEMQFTYLSLAGTVADARKRLGRLPPTLADTYLLLYSTIEDLGGYTFHLAAFTFQWLLCAKSEITTDNFAAIASMVCPIEDSGGSIPRDAPPIPTATILKACVNFVTVQQDELVFAHLSVREFLESLRERNPQEEAGGETADAVATTPGPSQRPDQRQKRYQLRDEDDELGSDALSDIFPRNTKL
ncbi:Ankyrin repeat-containing protein [Cordyceps javanica]|uniref:Ankyrin repeat-containing protein n=1 Tax=Cordyceps javanica TaxID=43265 RepID=A0A545VKR6_9HYPO|nr:Ankyrin repeat-containing protein [Cordyceps javanica]TQW02246.1 Ankyrin repeat-containing protein [Cordyceps javanica]